MRIFNQKKSGFKAVETKKYDENQHNAKYWSLLQPEIQTFLLHPFLHQIPSSKREKLTKIKYANNLLTVYSYQCVTVTPSVTVTTCKWLAGTPLIQIAAWTFFWDRHRSWWHIKIVLLSPQLHLCMQWILLWKGIFPIWQFDQSRVICNTLSSALNPKKCTVLLDDLVPWALGTEISFCLFRILFEIDVVLW